MRWSAATSLSCRWINKRHWYRYHHLFADVLSAHLLAEQPEQIPVLHWRASVWYEQHGFTDDAIRHALAAKDFERAADLVELAMPAMSKSRQEATLLGWLNAIPNEVIHFRPVLSIGYVGALLSNGKQEGVEVLLRDAEEWLHITEEVPTQPNPENAHAGREEHPLRAAAMVVRDEETFRRLPAVIAVYRSGQALSVGNVSDTLKYSQQALELLPQEEDFWRGAACALLGLAQWAEWRSGGSLPQLCRWHGGYGEDRAHL